MFQRAGDEEGRDKRSVYTLLCGVVARLRQWGGVGRRRGGEGGSKFGLSQIPPIAHLTKVYLPCEQKLLNFFLLHYKLSLTFLTTLCRLFVNFLLLQ